MRLTYTTIFLFITLSSAERMLTPKQAIVCDACLRQKSISSCDSYIPSSDMFNHKRPDPAKPMGIWVCEPSEWEFWSTDGKFKVGDTDHQPDVVPPCESRRTAISVGTLATARRFCESVKQANIPTQTMSTCTDLMKKIAPSSQGRVVDCSMRKWEATSTVATVRRTVTSRAASTATGTTCPAGKYGPDCSIEQECATPVENNCDFYTKCLQAKRPCDVVQNVCLPKCQEYQELEPKLSSNGQAWSKYVRVCLQQRMAANVLIGSGSSFTCDAVEESFFNDHLPCYLDGPISFCSLGLLEKTRIYYHASSIFWKGYLKEATVAGVKLLSACGMHSFHLDLSHSSADKSAESKGWEDWVKVDRFREIFAHALNASKRFNDELRDVEAELADEIGNQLDILVQVPEKIREQVTEEDVEELIRGAIDLILGSNKSYMLNGEKRSSGSGNVKEVPLPNYAIITLASVGSVAVIAAVGTAIWLRRRRSQLNKGEPLLPTLE